MLDIDDAILDEFIDVIYTRIEQKFAKQLNKANVEYAFLGIVQSIDTTTNTAVVDIGTATTTSIPNNTGLTLGATGGLNIGDSVKVFSDRKNMVGAYIGVKLN